MSVPYPTPMTTLLLQVLSFEFPGLAFTPFRKFPNTQKWKVSLADTYPILEFSSFLEQTTVTYSRIVVTYQY
jgi:hypothetical protein